METRRQNEVTQEVSIDGKENFKKRDLGLFKVCNSQSEGEQAQETKELASEENQEIHL